MMKKIITAIAMSVVCIFTSCQEDVLTKSAIDGEAEVIDDDFSVVNGRIAFEDPEAFRNVYAKVYKMDANSVDSWIKNLSIQPFDITKSIIYDNPLIEILSPFMNNEGEFQVGSDFVWIKNDTEYILKNSDEAKFQEFKTQILKGGDPSLFKNIEVLPLGESIKLGKEETQLSINSRGDGEVLEYGNITLKGYNTVYWLPVGMSKVVKIGSGTHRFCVNPYAVGDYYLGVLLGVRTSFEDRKSDGSWKVGGDPIRGEMSWQVSANAPGSSTKTYYYNNSSFETASGFAAFGSHGQLWGGSGYTKVLNVKFYINNVHVYWYKPSNSLWDPVKYSLTYKNATYKYDQIGVLF